jgi:hypothetical protein
MDNGENAALPDDVTNYVVAVATSSQMVVA